ncbi:RND transporter [Acinetobacter venetianus]|jgi:adhesin transport system outer membrane protein|uniref:TolC family protein n=1 Tax=Acinetobacter TaxID=469 RepID=UPI000235F989|nr:MULTISPECIES: TolC family protein [Acinetobacter]MDA0696252.1 TolC family protein [Pseudomonadota bacterium]KXO85576.1 RND transporter [Acinetobacter venetianus]KXZ66613.1 Outer membrane protein TolC precursor [Acinetobacter venetianus]MBC70178.1 RND transporter [Acinetobacter sp.]MBT48563.1 RND transporter [Acinetobacter sp.]|tara:strand:- start:812 stop:2347 length:1536 start_codon:yes stop_codon:yes gene_type:complete
MSIKKDLDIDDGTRKLCIDFKWVIYAVTFSVPITHAATPSEKYHSLKNNLSQLIAPKSSDDFKTANMQQLSNFSVNPSTNALPVVGSGRPVEVVPAALWQSQRKLLKDAVQIAVQRNPEISQTLATLAAQNANIDVAKAGYYPQITGGVNTGDLTQKTSRGQQVLALNATQMLYDFGKVKSGVNTEQAKLAVEQANVLVKIDDISLDVAQTIINIQRYKKLIQIADQQIIGIKRIQEMANLRANAGISSQADPVQAQSYLQSAQSALIAQQSLLGQYQQHLTTLLGFDASNVKWTIPEDLVQQSDLYAAPQFNIIPQMIAAQAGIIVARSQKQQTQLSRYPTLSVKGELSQALHGVNPNNNKDGGFDSAIMLEASSQFYQGGATSSQIRAASFAEEAAKAQVNAVYLQVLDQIRTSREQIENKQRQMQVLISRQATTVRTRELYQEQYKLGTRSLVDLLNAEQAIHGANSELESARYDIYNSIAQYIATTGRSRQAYDLNNISIQGFEVQP